MYVFVTIVMSAGVYFLLTQKPSAAQTIVQFNDEAYNRVMYPAQRAEPVFTKVVEATENATELPNGTVLSIRRVRQWQ